MSQKEPHLEHAQSDGAPRPHWLGRALLATLLLGCALRLYNAWNTSLWLDDFHSLYHAQAQSLGLFFQELLRDNHPPLSFLLLRLSERLLGAGELALHAPNALVALATAGLLWRLTGKLNGDTPRDQAWRIAALGFLCFSAMHVDLSSNLRMYALLGLSVLGLLSALIELFERQRGAVACVAWLAIGLHTHYHFLHAALLLLMVSLVLILGVKPYRSSLRPLLTCYGLGALLALPWFAFGFTQQLEHGLPPGGSSSSAARLAMGLLHLLHQGVGDHGSSLRLPLLIAGALGLLCAGLGQLKLLAQAKESLRPAPALLIAGAAFLLPVWTAAAAAISTRAGFESRYLAGALAPMALLAGLGGFAAQLGPEAMRKPRALAGGIALLGALLLSSLLARSPGHEDYRSASAYVLGQVRSGDAVLAVDSQPPLFPQGIGWDYYSRRLISPGKALPPRLEHDQAFNLLRPEQLMQYERVHCVLRSIPKNAPLLRTLRSSFQEERAQSFGRAVFVLSFSQRIDH